MSCWESKPTSNIIQSYPIPQFQGFQSPQIFHPRRFILPTGTSVASPRQSFTVVIRMQGTSSRAAAKRMTWRLVSHSTWYILTPPGCNTVLLQDVENPWKSRKILETMILIDKSPWYEWGFTMCSPYMFTICSKLPSGKLSHNYGKSPFFMGQLTISMGHFQWLFITYFRPEDLRLCDVERLFQLHGVDSNQHQENGTNSNQP